LCPLLRLAAVIGAFVVGGCSYQLSSLASKRGADGEQTGALGQAAHEADAVPPPEADLAYARAVAADALARGGKDDSVPWHNPDTGAGGNITPLATSYGEGAFTCRDFLASYVRGQREAWLQGEACRTSHGRWEVKSLTPLTRG
jgi:17 kDa outer membrane surface antigen